MTRTLRTLTHPGWVTKPAPDIDANRLTDLEVDDNFLEMEQRTLPVFNVKGRQFGGTPSAAQVSQLTAINDALQAAKAAGGGIVVLEADPNPWWIDGRILVPSNCELHNQAGAQLLQMDGTNEFMIVNEDTVNGNVNCRVTGLGLIDGRVAAQDQTNNATNRYSVVSFVRCTRPQVIGVEVTGGLRTGTFPTVSTHGSGVELTLCTDIYVGHVRSRQNRYDGIKTRGCVNGTIERCYLPDNDRSGIQLSTHTSGGGNNEWNGTGDINNRADGTLGVVCNNNTIIHSTGVAGPAAPRTSGIYFHSASDCITGHNVITGVDQAIGGFDASENNRVHHSYLGARGQCVGWQEASLTGNIVEFNECVGEDSAGLFLEEQGTGNKFRDNNCRLAPGVSGTWTIDVLAGATDAVVENNEPDNVTINNLGTNTTIRRKTDTGGGGSFDPQLDTLSVVGGNITWNLDPENLAEVTLNANATLNNPPVLRVGKYSLIVRQDPTGGRTLAYGSNYSFPGGVDPVVTAAADRITILEFECDGTTMFGRAAGLDYTVSAVITSGSDEFTGTTAGLPAGYTQGWNTTNVTFAEGSGVLSMNNSINDRTAFTIDQMDGENDVEVLAKVRTVVVDGGNGVTHIGIVLRFGGTEGSELGYSFRVGRISGNDRIALGRYDGTGSFIPINESTPSPFALASNTYYWMRARISGTTLSLKAWLDGNAEPGAFQVTDTDANIASGNHGVFAFTAGDNDIDFLSWANNGGTAPGP